MSSASRKRKAHARRMRAFVKKCDLIAVHATAAPPWSKQTADEIIANCRKLLGHSPMADFVAGYELRARFVWPQRPMVHFIA